MISVPRLKNLLQRDSDGQLKIDVIQAEPEATAKTTLPLVN